MILLLAYMSTAPDDYTGIQNQPLTFRAQLPPMSVHVTILNELNVEDNETFYALLVLVTGNPRVQIDPSLAEVLIQDDDGMYE